jgi:serpin B
MRLHWWSRSLGSKTRRALRRTSRPPRLEPLEDRNLLAAGGPATGTGFIDGLYRDLLHRTPDAVGSTYWTGQLDQGVPPATIATQIMASPEGRAVEVNDLYRSLLGRDAEPAGLAAWEQYLATGGTVQGLQVGILASPEYAARPDPTSNQPPGNRFVSRLYADVLGRSATADEVAAWVQVLDAGAGRPAVAAAIVQSPEAVRHTVAGWYQTYLHRPAETTGLGFWQAELAQATDLNRVRAEFLGSVEYAGPPVAAPVVTDPTAGGSSPVGMPGEAVKAFETDLYAQLAAQGGNVAFSPFSIETALAMVYAGARGQTADELAAVLHLGPNTATTHADYGALIAKLLADGNASGSELAIANALWGQAGYNFRTEFLDLLQSAYGADLRRVDFAHASEAARATINGWVSEQTHGKIQGLFPPGSLDSSTRLALANAVYFKGDWAQPFDPNLTHDGRFFRTPGEAVTVPLMNQTGSFAYGDRDGVQTLEMGYAGGRLVMDVLLPEQANGLGALEQQLAAGHLADLVSGLGQYQVAVTLPRFQVKTQYDLKGPLEALGMRTVFDRKAADLSGMNGGTDPLYVSAAVHKAYVSVDEKGTEAAAATGIGVSPTAVFLPPPPVTFRADHPFVYVIRDPATNTVLFLGRVSDPSQ